MQKFSKINSSQSCLTFVENSNFLNKRERDRCEGSPEEHSFKLGRTLTQIQRLASILKLKNIII
ncbi:hypothetical protein LEP1GSC059_4312 [Leptospira noguchii serovar Panama str. CZ214]|uniref:Uncharacterized protein n=1 Tax=Leptospira noguchii serovar Panama str. CZ214 TaxID=1001595 RepID=T0GT08_9LEPT|nr:hypothetical protein LEP1GSC059_4312 [Leptospira noguchii serovar Panama str. CZ214]